MRLSLYCLALFALFSGSTSMAWGNDVLTCGSASGTITVATHSQEKLVFTIKLPGFEESFFRDSTIYKVRFLRKRPFDIMHKLRKGGMFPSGPQIIEYSHGAIAIARKDGQPIHDGINQLAEWLICKNTSS